KIEASRVTQFVLESLQTGVIIIPQEPNGRIEIDLDKLRPILNELDEYVTDYWQKLEEISAPIELPEDFDPSANARRSMRDAVDIMHRHGIVERDWLVETSKLAGPGNTE